MRKSNIQTLFVLRFSVLSSLLLSSRICLLLSPKDVVLSEGAVDITSEGRLEVLESSVEVIFVFVIVVC